MLIPDLASTLPTLLIGLPLPISYIIAVHLETYTPSGLLALSPPFVPQDILHSSSINCQYRSAALLNAPRKPLKRFPLFLCAPWSLRLMSKCYALALSPKSPSSSQSHCDDLQGVPYMYCLIVWQAQACAVNYLQAPSSSFLIYYSTPVLNVHLQDLPHRPMPFAR